jgi:uncharacterized protein YjdB
MDMKKEGMLMKCIKRAMIFTMMIWLVVGNRRIAEAVSYRGADVTTPSGTNLFIAVEGNYPEIDIDAVVNRVNEMRQEAYNEGLVSQYVPVQWDYGLEYIAQYRAAEATIYYAHERPNGTSNSTLSYNGYSTATENLAMGYTTSEALDALEFWYDEKEDITTSVKDDAPHYEALIRPELKYIGLGAFRNKNRNDLKMAAELKATPSGLASARVTGDYVQTLEISGSNAGNVAIIGSGLMGVRDTQTLQLYAAYSTYSQQQSVSGLKGRVTSSVTWSSSNTSVASVDSSSGKVTAKANGTTTIKATAGTLSTSYTLIVGPTTVSGTLPEQTIDYGKSPYLPSSGTVTWNDGTTSTVSLSWEADTNDYYVLDGADYTLRAVANGKLVTKTVHVNESQVLSTSFSGLRRYYDVSYCLDAEYGKAPSLPKTVDVKYISGSTQFTKTQQVSWNTIDKSKYMVDNHRPVSYYVNGVVEDGRNNSQSVSIRVYHARDQYVIENPSLTLRVGIKPEVGTESYNLPKQVEITWANGDKENLDVEWDLDEINNYPEKTYQNTKITQYTVSGVAADSKVNQDYPINVTAVIYVSKETAFVETANLHCSMKNGRNFNMKNLSTTAYLEWDDGICTKETATWLFDVEDYRDIIYSYAGGSFEAPFLCAESGYQGIGTIYVDRAECYSPVFLDASGDEMKTPLTVAYGECPDLPSYVQIEWSNDTVTRHSITWDDVSSVKYSQENGNTFVVSGSYRLDGLDMKFPKDSDYTRYESITVTQEPYEGTEDLSGNYVLLQSLELESSVEQFYVGDVYQLSVTCSPENATNTSVVWTSSDESIAIVDEKGIVHPLKRGAVTITATSADEASKEVKAQKKFYVFEQTGTLGEDDSVRWYINRKTGYLIVTGEGEIPSFKTYPNPYECPWRYNQDVKFMVVGEGITSIGDYAFMNLDQLLEVHIAAGTKTIGKYAFNEDILLNTIKLPKTLEEIKEYAFYHTKIQSFNLHSNIKKLDGNSFSGTSALKISIYGDAPEVEGDYMQPFGCELDTLKDASGYNKGVWSYLKISHCLTLTKDVDNVIRVDDYEEYHIDESEAADEENKEDVKPGTTEDGASGQEDEEPGTTEDSALGQEDEKPGTTEDGASGQEDEKPGTTEDGAVGKMDKTVTETTSGITSKQENVKDEMVEKNKQGKTEVVTPTFQQSSKVTVPKVKSVKVTAKKKKLVISWKKASGVSGYQIQISTKSNFKGKKSIFVKKSKNQYTVKLKAKKKYYIRIRAYKNYEDEFGDVEKKYGKWVKLSKKTK